MLFDINQIKNEHAQSRGNRELWKWIFSIGTLGIGGLYLWSTTNIIREGEIGIRQTASGNMELLPPGRHSNFPWESYPEKVQPLSKKIIQLGPYKIITVDTGYVAKTSNKGKLEILPVGQHLISDASHTFDGLIPVKQETKKLQEVIASTSDNVSLTMHADVRYIILDPDLAVANIDDIENSIKEIAEINISQIVSHHSLADFAPAITNFGGEKTHGISDVLKEVTRTITEQFIQLGIKLLNIGITSWQISDKSLAHELAQGAVIKSQTQSQLMAAENAAKVLSIQTEAEANAIIIRAKADALAIEEKGKAYKMIADSLGGSPVGQSFYQSSQQIEMVSHSKNANLFFSPLHGTNQNLPSLVTTIPSFQ